MKILELEQVDGIDCSNCFFFEPSNGGPCSLIGTGIPSKDCYNKIFRIKQEDARFFELGDGRYLLLNENTIAYIKTEEAQ